MLFLMLVRGLMGGWAIISFLYEFWRRFFFEERVVVVIGFVFSNRLLLGERLAMLAMEVSFVCLGESILLPSIRFWVSSREDNMASKNIVIKQSISDQLPLTSSLLDIFLHKVFYSQRLDNQHAIKTILWPLLSVFARGVLWIQTAVTPYFVVVVEIFLCFLLVAILFLPTNLFFCKVQLFADCML